MTPLAVTWKRSDDWSQDAKNEVLYLTDLDATNVIDKIQMISIPQNTNANTNADSEPEQEEEDLPPAFFDMDLSDGIAHIVLFYVPLVSSLLMRSSYHMHQYNNETRM